MERALLAPFKWQNGIFEGLQAYPAIREYLNHHSPLSPDASASGGVFTPEAYVRFCERNGMRGLADELIDTVSAEQAERIIQLRFSQSRYNREEMLALREQYQRLIKPIAICAMMVTRSEGIPLVSGQAVHSVTVDNFDDFSDGFITVWQRCWHSEAMAEISQSKDKRAYLKARDYSVVTWFFEVVQQDELVGADWMESLPQVAAMKPRRHQKTLGKGEVQKQFKRHLELLFKRTSN